MDIFYSGAISCWIHPRLIVELNSLDPSAWYRGEFTNSIRRYIAFIGCDCESGINTDLNRHWYPRNTEWNSTPTRGLALRDPRQLSPRLRQFSLYVTGRYALHLCLESQSVHIWVWQDDQVYAGFLDHKRSLIVEPIKYEEKRGLMKAQIAW